MRVSRRKVSAPLREIQDEIDRLLRLDAENQKQFSATVIPIGYKKLSKRQLHILTEAIFFSAFRAYENFLEDVFCLYCLEKTPLSGNLVKSFLKPKDFVHAGELIQSSMRFLDWTSPDEMIKRAELYLFDGFPVKNPYTLNKTTLTDLKRLRNHIAHNSKESLDGYKIVLRRHYGTNPLILLPPGEFLLKTDTADPTKYKLIVYLEFLKQIASDLT